MGNMHTKLVLEKGGYNDLSGSEKRDLIGTVCPLPVAYTAYLVPCGAGAEQNMIDII